MCVVIGASLPPGVDPSQRELYLENESFKKLFGMDKVRYVGNEVVVVVVVVVLVGLYWIAIVDFVIAKVVSPVVVVVMVSGSR